MSRGKIKLVKRVMAVVLSGMVVLAGVPSFSMTVYGAEHYESASETDDRNAQEDREINTEPADAESSEEQTKTQEAAPSEEQTQINETKTTTFEEQAQINETEIETSEEQTQINEIETESSEKQAKTEETAPLEEPKETDITYEEQQNAEEKNIDKTETEIETEPQLEESSDEPEPQSEDLPTETAADEEDLPDTAEFEESNNEPTVQTLDTIISTKTISNTSSNKPSAKAKDIQITDLNPSYDYTGAKITPNVSVWDCDIEGGRRLTQGTDYTIAYKDNVNAGTNTAKIIVTGKGNYKGKDVTATFSIVKAEPLQTFDDVKGARIDKISDESYDGTLKTPNFKLTLKGGAPVEYRYNKTDKQYERTDGKAMNVNVALSNNVNKGTATILVTGRKDAKGIASSVKKTFRITAADISRATVTATAGTYTANGAAPKSLTVQFGKETLINGTDYTVKYTNNKKAGQGTAVIIGKGNYAKKSVPTL